MGMVSLVRVMQGAAGAQAFDGHDVGAFGVQGTHVAGSLPTGAAGHDHFTVIHKADITRKGYSGLPAVQQLAAR